MQQRRLQLERSRSGWAAEVEALLLQPPVTTPTPMPEEYAEDAALRLLERAERLLAERAARASEATRLVAQAEVQARSIVEEARLAPTSVLASRLAAHDSAARAQEHLRLAAGALAAAREELFADDPVGLEEVRERVRTALAPMTQALAALGLAEPTPAKAPAEAAGRTPPPRVEAPLWSERPTPERLIPQRAFSPPPRVDTPVAVPAPSGPEPELSLGQARMARTGLWTRNFGIVTLLFVAFQLWGTDVSQAQSQRTLKSEFETAAPMDASAGGEVGVDELPVTAPRGDAVAVLEIPAIGVSQAVVEGTDLDSLRKGPGHYRRSPFPGEAGNVAIAGHRTTYGAPFNRLDELQTGDVILLTTRQGRVSYEVAEQRIVKPSDLSVLAASPDDRLTLTTCNPKYRMSERLVVVAKATSSVEEQLGTAQRPPGSGQAEVESSPVDGEQPTDVAEGEEDLGGDLGALIPTLLWMGVLAVVGRAVFLLGERWIRRPAYAMGVSVLTIVLYQLFSSLNRLLPAAL